MSKSNKLFKLIICLVVCCVGTEYIEAQQSGISVELNLGTSPGSPLRAFHNSLTEQVSFENFKTTDNFYINYGFSAGFTLEDMKSSFFYANRVSGAKTSVSDYSGYLRLTNELKGHTLGYKYYLPIGSNPNKNLFVQFKALVTVTQFDNLDFKSIDYGAGAGIIYEYPLGFIVLRAYLDLDIYYGGKMKLKDRNVDDGFLLDDNGNKLTTGWGGLTSGMGITIAI